MPCDGRCAYTCEYAVHHVLRRAAPVCCSPPPVSPQPKPGPVPPRQSMVAPEHHGVILLCVVKPWSNQHPPPIQLSIQNPHSPGWLFCMGMQHAAWAAPSSPLQASSVAAVVKPASVNTEPKSLPPSTQDSNWALTWLLSVPRAVVVCPEHTTMHVTSPAALHADGLRIRLAAGRRGERRPLPPAPPLAEAQKNERRVVSACIQRAARIAAAEKPLHGAQSVPWPEAVDRRPRA